MTNTLYATDLNTNPNTSIARLEQEIATAEAITKMLTRVGKRNVRPHRTGYGSVQVLIGKSYIINLTGDHFQLVTAKKGREIKSGEISGESMALLANRVSPGLLEFMSIAEFTERVWSTLAR